jgi:hypothetical protein
MTFRNIFMAAAILLSSTAIAQDKPLSPAQTAEGKIGDAKITIEYNAPSVRDRAVWGELVPYDKVWRTGANEATRFTTDQDIMIEGQALPSGTYALFTIPGEDGWTIIFNKDPKQWGAYKYNKDMDALRVNVKAAPSSTHQEQMLFEVAKDQVNLKWEKLAVSFSIQPMA